MYSNPVISGFYPDPSVCRVDENYFLVTSSCEYFPSVPIFHSRDLVHWRQIGHCLTRSSQVALQKCASSQGIFAPTIRYHEGIFYMTTTNVSAGGNFYVYTDDPFGEWSEPIWIDLKGIDPSLFFDTDGRVYVSANGHPAGIYLCEIDPQTGQRRTGTHCIWKGTGGRFPEAPHVYYLNDSYYLMIAEGGTEYGHMASMARSTSPWGPFEPCPHNPILTHRDRGFHPIQGTGHADLVEAHDGSWWLVFLAFRPCGGDFHHLGRETYLAPVSWTDDGWPVANHHRGIELTMDTPTLPQHPWPGESSHDDFDQSILRLSWNFLRNPYAQDWSLTDRPGWLRLYGSPLSLDAQDSPAFIGRRQQHFSCKTRSLLDFTPGYEGEEAGLVVLANERHHYEIALTCMDGRRSIIVRRRVGDLVAIVAQQIIEDSPVELEIQASADMYVFSYALPGQSLHLLATGATRYLSSEVVGSFTGVYLGMYATGNGRANSAPADFDWFEYLPESLQPY
jgi:alpha-N-arabinofuranosidase